MSAGTHYQNGTSSAQTDITILSGISVRETGGANAITLTVKDGGSSGAVVAEVRVGASASETDTLPQVRLTAGAAYVAIGGTGTASWILYGD